MFTKWRQPSENFPNRSAGSVAFNSAAGRLAQPFPRFAVGPRSLPVFGKGRGFGHPFGAVFRFFFPCGLVLLPSISHGIDLQQSIVAPVLPRSRTPHRIPRRRGQSSLHGVQVHVFKAGSPAFSEGLRFPEPVLPGLDTL